MIFLLMENAERRSLFIKKQPVDTLVQAEPVLFDKEASLKKVLNYIDEAAAACKMEHDAVSHYARPDVLELKINDK